MTIISNRSFGNFEVFNQYSVAFKQDWTLALLNFQWFPEVIYPHNNQQVLDNNLPQLWVKYNSLDRCPDINLQAINNKGPYKIQASDTISSPFYNYYG